MTANFYPIVENFASNTVRNEVANLQSTQAILCGIKHPTNALFDTGIQTKSDFVATVQHAPAAERSREVCVCAQAFITMSRSCLIDPHSKHT